MVAKLRIMASSSVLPTAGAATRPVLHSRPPTRAAARRSKQAIAGIADEPPTPYQGPPSKKRKVVGSSKKKSMIVILRVPSTRLSSYDLSSENEPAIQPLSTRKRKRASGVNTTAVSASTEDRRPDPCGVPSAWAGVSFFIAF